MNRDQAKLILQSYRISGKDANDPHFKEALELLKHDPELAKWFEEETQLDAAISGKIKEASTPPPDLKESILTSFKIIRPTPWWKQTTTLSAVAAILLLCAIAAFLFNPLKIDINVYVNNDEQTEELLADFRKQMVGFITDSSDHLAFPNADLNEVRSWLSSENAHDDFIVPAGLKGRPTLGCRVLSWQKKTVSFVCFEIADQEMVHMFVVNRDNSAPKLDSPTSPLFQQEGMLSTAFWEDKDKQYLLVSELSESKLRTHL